MGRHGSRALTLAFADHSPDPPSLWLRIGAVALPVLKCAVCPACLGLVGSLLAGARMGFLEDERVHGAVLLVALAADVAILGASLRHHGRRGPLVLCALGALLALGGHLASGFVEYAGFALLFAAGIWNLRLLRRHHHQHGGDCCGHRSSRLHAEA
jgi:hypothetical protein